MDTAQKGPEITWQGPMIPASLAASARDISVYGGINPANWPWADIIAVAEHIRDLNTQYVAAWETERDARAAERLQRAYAEQRVIRAYGGDEKALGSNEDARKRTFRIALADDPVYGDARRALEVAELELLRVSTTREQAMLDLEVARIRAGVWK